MNQSHHRRATADDLPRITEIYNHYITTTHVSFDTEPWTADQRRSWWERYEAGWQVPGYPWVVHVTELDGTVVGGAWSSPYRSKAAYRSSVETTIVLDPAVLGRGMGSGLYRNLLDELDARGVHRQYAVVALPNDASVALHHRLGFTTQAVQDEVGFKGGRYWSTMLLQRIPG